MSGDPGPFDETLLAQFLDDYFAECDEHLTTIRTGVLTLERAIGRPGLDEALLDRLLRAFHSIKGLSGMVGVTGAEQLSHAVESELRTLRQRGTGPSPLMYDSLVAATRSLEQVIHARRTGEPAPDIAPLLERLEGAAATPLADPRAAGTGDPDAEQAARLAAAAGRGARAWSFSFVSSSELAARGVHVNSVRARLEAIGELIKATPRVLEGGRVAFDFLVAGPADESAFFGWEADGITYVPYPLLEPPAAGEVASAQAEHPSVAPANYVRVDLARLDELMRRVGELTVGRVRLSESLRCLERQLPVAEWRALQEQSLALERGLRDLRAAAMRVRLVPIGEVFARMQFVVHDLARAGRKQIMLEVSGQETEIDKLVVERIMDPLLHLVRNAVSHGLEEPAERLAQGKPAEGTVGLRAATRGDMVIIQVEDDGRGIDADRVVERARAAGLLSTGEQPDAERLLEIICAPGFSTRDEADLASGRGVGMAVVANTVHELGGTLSLDSRPGLGTRFTIQLPLTLVVVDALMVSAGGQTFAVPQLTLREVVEIEPSALRALENNELVYHRGAALPVLRLARLLGLPDDPSPAEAGRPVLYLLVLGSGAKSVALAVDRLCGQREIMVSAVSDPLLHVPGVAGAAELADGRVVLILDPPALVRNLHGEYAYA